MCKTRVKKFCVVCNRLCSGVTKTYAGRKWSVSLSLILYALVFAWKTTSQCRKIQQRAVSNRGLKPDCEAVSKSLQRSASGSRTKRETAASALPTTSSEADVQPPLMLFQKNVAATRGVSRGEQREVALLSEAWAPIVATIASIFAMVKMPILTI